MRFSKGDVLYGKMRPYLNKVWVAEFDGLCSTEFLVFPKCAGLNSRFLALRLSSEDFVTFSNEQISGERPRVDFDKLSGFPILLPPTSEQDRIVAKVDAVLTRIDKGQKIARRAQERLQRYHGAVLRAAVLGELTRDWRELHNANQSPGVETGQVVLRRILATRLARWEEAELQRLTTGGRKPKDNEWKSRHPIPTPPNTRDLPPLPRNWAWASLEMIADIGTGVSVSRNRILNDPIELPYLRVANVLRGHLDLTEVKTIRIEKAQVAQYLLRKGDLLFNEGGDRDKLGRGWIWEGQLPNCVHQNHVFRARLYDQTLVDARFVSYWANTFGQDFFIEHATQTVNLASINRDVLARLPVPIPPVAEQARIILELDRRLTNADRLATSLDEQLATARATRESLLREAFAGRLVDQNQDDEPASALLEKLRTAREAEARKPRPKRMPKPKIITRRRALLDVLREQKQLLTPEQLFERSGYLDDFVVNEYRQEIVDQFYEELRGLVGEDGPVRELRPNPTTIQLELKS